MKSFPTAKEAINTTKQLQELRIRGGFNLTKFFRNKQEVVQSISDDKRKPNVRNELVNLGNITEEKTLGVKLNTWNNTLNVYIKLADKPFRRSGSLSTLSSVYHPLGLRVPFFLKGRQTMQNLCRNKLKWDKAID